MEFHHLLFISVATLGFISLSKTFFGILKWIWVFFLRPPKNLKQYGSWAVVTGCTDGIGKALTLELATKGLNLVLIGRNPSKLEVTEEEIRKKHGDKILVKRITVDFEEASGEEVERAVVEGIEGLDVGVLVNSAGLAYPYAKFFHEVDKELMEGVMKVNVVAPTWVTRAVLPVMMRKKKGAIVNIGSASSGGLSSYPLYSIYAATKAYVAMFSRSICLEYRQHGIDVQCQIPLFVATKMVKLREYPFFIPSPEGFSKASVRWIGYDHLCVPYWSHSLQWNVLHSFPSAILDQFIFKYFQGMRKRGMAKDSKKAKEK